MNSNIYINLNLIVNDGDFETFSVADFSVSNFTIKKGLIMFALVIPKRMLNLSTIVKCMI